MHSQPVKIFGLKNGSRTRNELFSKNSQDTTRVSRQGIYISTFKNRTVWSVGEVSIIRIT